MSTSLKRLLEQDAARTTVSPAPVDIVLAGGRARVRRRRIVGVAAAVVLALLAIAVPIGLTQNNSQDKPIGPRPARTR
ncbi:MAG TPA: hypothetical protein VEX15_18860 [Nocardioidaceae bacterium]|nr:hypothetical protein [Nocardioidaceae bacterium]